MEAGAGDRLRAALLEVADAQAKLRLVEWSTRPCLTLRLLASRYWGWRGWRSTWSL